ncbi:unnamed protein product [Cladocopium goreaui]|uniref:Uncharacterized protein n=1 Tax=Cladocopium goreaui TaxID=2562237 RepID=A0A9P1BLH2_9DINO|nr:unnamed protein product [Cladocopium goreaui]
MIQAHIRFFSLTTPAAFFPHGLTLVDPMEAARLFGSWGLASVEAIEDVLATDRAAVERMEQKHLLLPNREGLGSGSVLVPAARWKNAWYVTVRALREKFCKRAWQSHVWKNFESWQSEFEWLEATVRHQALVQHSETAQHQLAVSKLSGSSVPGTDLFKQVLDRISKGNHSPEDGRFAIWNENG